MIKQFILDYLFTFHLDFLFLRGSACGFQAPDLYYLLSVKFLTLFDTFTQTPSKNMTQSDTIHIPTHTGNRYSYNDFLMLHRLIFIQIRKRNERNFENVVQKIFKETILYITIIEKRLFCNVAFLLLIGWSICALNELF